MKEKIKQKGFIQTPLLIAILSSVILVSVVITGAILIEKGKLTPLIVDILELFKGTQSETKLDLKSQKEIVSSQSSDEESQKRIETLEQKIKALEEKQQTFPQNQQPSRSESSEKDLVSIINHWRPVIAYIECDFNAFSITQSGSGLLGSRKLGENIVEFYVLTNKHVVNYGGYGSDICRIQFPNYEKTINIYHTLANPTTIVSRKGYDWATLDIKNPDEYLKNIYSQNEYMVCESPLLLGDSIIVLGYPSIGSKTDITATEGIVSGFDEEYYITSAKIDSGNSGGIAVSLKENCYVGIPSFATVGEIESLGRILKAQVIFKF